MIHPGRYDLLYRGLHVGISFGGGAVDHVQVDVCEPGRTGLCDRGECPARGVAALQHLQHVGAGGLHAQGDSGKPGVAEFREKLGAGGFGVGFGGDLRAWVDAEGVTDRGEDAAQALGPQQ